MIACRCVRETPVADGRKVWDLLTYDCSREAVEIAERYADGDATDEQLADAAWAARATARAATHAAWNAQDATMWAAADAARAAAWAAWTATESGDLDTACGAALYAADAAHAAASAATRAVTDWARTVAWTARAARDPAARAARDAAMAAQADLIRAIAGNPFR
jgi:hypothetical protein